MPLTDKLIINKLEAGDAIPYDLLLLADEELQAIERYIHQSKIFVVRIEGKIVGTYVLYPVDKLTVEIKAIAVDETKQNQGIGKMMLKHARETARKKRFQGFTYRNTFPSVQTISNLSESRFRGFCH